jgi:fibronectin type 3 domain-containing protein
MSFEVRGHFALLFWLGGLGMLAGCGKQGDPQPPLRAKPVAAQDLKAHQQGMRLLLDLGYPKTTAAGTALDGLKAIEVYEAFQPAPREGAPPPLDARVFSSSAQLRQTLADADVGAVTFGDRLIITLPLPEPLEDPARARYYGLYTVGKSGDRSDLSNIAAVVPKKPPAAPGNVGATARPDGVFVEWTPVEGVLGYGVYRRGSQERAYGAPVQLVPGVDQRSWLDTTARFGQSYIYAVTAIIQPNPLIESAITSEHEVRYTDRFAPPVPADLVALAEPGRVRVVWRASEAEDFAGYHVDRREEDGDFRRVTEQLLPTPEYLDTGVASGQPYWYRVTAVDQSGNESAPSPEVRAAVP